MFQDLAANTHVLRHVLTAETTYLTNAAVADFCQLLMWMQ